MASAVSASGIFISYRRTDNPDAVGRIYDRLVSEFGKSRVFKDVDSIPLGQDFRTHLNDVVGACAAVIAIIGPRWVDVRDSGGQRRLDDPDDFVRIELEAALARSIPVLPVLVGHAPMPGTRELPPSLATLAFRQGVDVRPDPDFHNDATRLVAALRRMLDPAAAARTEAEEAVRAMSRSAPAATAAAAAASTSRRAWGLAVAAGLVAVALAVPALKYLRQPPPAEMRTEIVTPATGRPLDFALSPDGRQIAFVAAGDGASQLWLRSLDSSTARALAGTEGAMRPFWSPDSRSIAFYTSTALKRLDLGGGQSRVLTTMSSFNPGGGSWGPGGVILYAPSITAPLMRVSAAGGDPVRVTALDTAQLAHFAPAFLPDGRRFLYQAGGSPDQAGIYLGFLDGKAPVRLAESGTVGAYLPSGWLVFARDQMLVAQRLDADNGRLTGEPVALSNLQSHDDVRGAGIASVSATGLIAYRTFGSRSRQLQWFDRTGASPGLFGEADGTYSNPRISPDGRRVAVDRTVNGNSDIWLLDGIKASRLTFDPQVDGRPVWTPDGRDIVFYSSRTGRLDLYRKSSEGAEVETPLLEGEPPNTDRIRVPTGFSPDGRYLLYFTASGQGAAAINAVRMGGDGKSLAWPPTPSNEMWGAISPDGRWMAYVSDETGRNEIYVKPFTPPDTGAAGAIRSQARWQVSAAGGSYPLWSPDGRELYFLSPVGDMMAAAVATTASSVASGAPVKLFATRIFGSGVESAQGRQYDVAADGRFLVNVQLESELTPPITLIQNWDPERVAAR